MEMIIVFILVLGVILFLSKNIKNEKLISTATGLHRGNRAERKLVLALLKKGIHPDAIFHDIYLQKRNGKFSQIDAVVATAVGLIVIEVKCYSGRIYGSGNHTYWTQVLAFGREKYRLYNPLFQNRRHIEELRKMSTQFAKIPMFSVIVFYGNCEFFAMDQMPNDTILIKSHEIDKAIDGILQRHPAAQYSNKREIMSVLNKACENGDIIEVHQQHVADIQSMKFRKPLNYGR